MTAAQDVRDAAAWLTSPSAGGGRDWYSADAQAKLAAHAARLQAAADRLDRLEPVRASAAPRITSDPEDKPGPGDTNGVLYIPADLEFDGAPDPEFLAELEAHLTKPLHVRPEEPETRSVRSASGTARLPPPRTLADRVADLERRLDYHTAGYAKPEHLDAKHPIPEPGVRTLPLLDDGTGTWHGNTYVPGGADPATYLVRPGIDYPRSAEEMAPAVLRSRRRRRPWFVR